MDHPACHPITIGCKAWAEVMEIVHRLPLSYLDKQGSGDFVRITTDVEQPNSDLLASF